MPHYGECRVESYFINVDVGDGAVHILLRNDKLDGAVLIDGGREPAAGKLQSAIATLRNKYNNCRFNSIVVTHWDGDHFRALLKILYEDMKDKLPDQWSYVDKKKTVFYCPWTCLEKIEKENRFTIKQSTTNFELYLKVDRGNGTYTETFICKAVPTTYCLGHDLFTGKSIFGNDGFAGIPNGVPNLPAAYQQSTVLNTDNGPIFLCVCVDVIFIDKGFAMPQEGWKAGANAKLMNASSIMATIIWPTNTGKNRISLYTGGDAEEELERLLLDWVGTNTVLDVVKAGHHGSHFATPEGLVALENQAFVVSAGDEYGHPSFSLVFFLLMLALYRQNEGKPWPIIVGTRMPYWIDKPASDLLTGNHFNIETVLSYKGDASAFYKALQELAENDPVKRALFDAELQEAALHMKSCFFLEYSQKTFDKLDKLFGGESPLAKLSNWTQPSRDGTVHSGDEYLNAQEAIRKTIRTRWAQYGFPKSTYLPDVVFVTVVAKGNDPKVVVDLIPDLATSAIAVQVLNNMIGSAPAQKPAPKGKRKALPFVDHTASPNLLKKAISKIPIGNKAQNPDKTAAADERYRALRKKRGFSDDLDANLYPSRASNLLRAAAGATLRSSDDEDAAELAKWTVALLTDELAKRSDLPTALDRFRHGQPESAWCNWFANCFRDSSATLLFSGRATGGVVTSLSQIDLEIALPKATGAPVLVFSTAAATRLAQFGSDGVDASNTTVLGVDRRLRGMILGLDTPACTGIISMGDLARMINFPLSKMVADFLGNIPLRPRSAAGSRSGIWFVPCHDNRTIMRLELELAQDAPGVTGLEQLLKDGLGEVHVTNMIVTGTCVNELQTSNGIIATGTLGIQADLKWQSDSDALPGCDGTVFLEFMEEGFGITLMFKKATASTDGLSTLLGEVQHKVHRDKTTVVKDEDAGAAAKQISSMLGTVMDPDMHIRTISMTFGKDRKPLSFETLLEVGLPFAGGDKRAPFLVAFQWTPGTIGLSAQLWNSPYFGDIPAALYPYHDTRAQLDTWTAVKYKGGISIKDLVKEPNLILPSGIPDTINEASLSLSYGGGRTTVALSAGLECSPQETKVNDPGVPALWFDDVYLALVLVFGGKTGTDVSMRFDATITLYLAPNYPEDIATDRTIHVKTRVDYAKTAGQSSFSVTGEVENIKIANIFDMFAADGSNHAIMDVMGCITIAQAAVSYDYSAGSPSRLKINGLLLLGPPESLVALSLEYSHDKGKNYSWSFDASLKAVDSTKVYKVAGLLSGLVEDVNALPEVVRNLEIPLGKLELKLACRSATDAQGEKHAIFALSIILDKTFTLTFAQVRSYDGRSSKPSTPGRLLRFSLSKLPEVPKLPVVGQVDIPFDQLGVVWANRDLTAREVAVLNQEVFQGPLCLLVKENKPTEDKTKLPGFAAGLHFQVALLEQSVPKLVLDHVVGGKKKKGPDRKARDDGGAGGNIATDDDAGDDAAKSVAPMARTVGALSVSNIGLSVEGASFSKVQISLDASVRLGPVAFGLLGLTIAVDLSGIRSPAGFMTLAPVASVNGMAAAFDKPPTRIAGVFRKFGGEKDASTGFEGAVAVSISAWGAVAGGVYEEVRATRTKSFFVFGMLQGLIAEFGAAEINGMTGGFGYNSRLTLPDVTGVTTFPFIAMNNDTPPLGGVLAQLAILMGREGQKKYIDVAPGEMWFIAGLGFKAFQMIDGQAIAALTLSAEPKFAILAQATAVFPKTFNPRPPPANPLEGAFLVIDIGLLVAIDPCHGTVLAAGELTPRSFVLNPSCHLTGGFALAFFLPGSDHDGDWVFSVGGYHPRFVRPSHYPVVASRVGITWQYDSQIYISGEAYFALSPHVAMGGGRLDLVVDKGWLRVVFSAYADFFMHFHPFYFEADVGICLCASVTLPCKLFTLHLGPLEFSASLSLHGPPVAGVASLHLWRWSVTVCFGPPPLPMPALDLDHFIRMIKNVAQDAEQSVVDATPAHLLSITKGAVTPGEAAAAANSGKNDADSPPTEIRGSLLQFEVQTRVPVLSATISGQDRHDTVTVDGKTVTPRIFARPMQRPDAFAASHLVISLVRTKSSEVVSLNATPILKDMPPALWGEKVEKPDSATGAPLLQHVMGYEVAVPTKPPSSESLPVISLASFSTVDVGEKDKIPAIPPVEKPGDDKELTLKTMAARNEILELRTSDETSAPPPSLRDGALAAWRSFKDRYSHGGLGSAGANFESSFFAAAGKLADQAKLAQSHRLQSLLRSA